MADIINHPSSYKVSRTTEPLQNGDGGGTYDDMEARIQTLEYRAEAADQRLGRIEDKLDRALEGIARMDGKLSNMPTTLQLVGLVFAVMAATFAILRFGLPIAG